MRKLLIVTYHFPPSSASGSFRLLGFARHLPKYGWRTVVVAPPTTPWEPVDLDLGQQVPAETTVYPVPYPSNPLLRRVAPVDGWLPRGLAASARAIREQRPDVVLTSSPPHHLHLLGLVLKRRFGVPWVVDFRDPWVADGKPRPGRRSRQEARLEDAVIRGADLIIANAPGAGEMLQAAYPEHRAKVVSVPNGYDRERFPAPSRDLDSPRDAVEVVHTGALYAGRNPRPFLDAVKDLAQANGPRCRVLLFGQPPEDRFDLEAEIRERDLEGVVVPRGQVSYGDSLRAMVDADILLLIDSPGRRIGVPAKLYEYIGAGRPILALGEPDGDLARVLAECGRPYRLVSPEHPEAIRDALADLARSSTTHPATDPDAALKFTREALAGRLADVLDGLNQRGIHRGERFMGDRIQGIGVREPIPQPPIPITHEAYSAVSLFP